MKNDYYFISELFIMKFLLSQSKSDKSFFSPRQGCLTLVITRMHKDGRVRIFIAAVLGKVNVKQSHLHVHIEKRKGNRGGTFIFCCKI